MTAKRAAVLSAAEFRSPLAAHARIYDAISAFTVDVRFASGSIAVASQEPSSLM
jgi:hypothetical protein